MSEKNPFEPAPPPNPVVYPNMLATEIPAWENDMIWNYRYSLPREVNEYVAILSSPRLILKHDVSVAHRVNSAPLRLVSVFVHPLPGVMLVITKYGRSLLPRIAESGLIMLKRMHLPTSSRTALSL